jgi:hypothetical protein
MNTDAFGKGCFLTAALLIFSLFCSIPADAVWTDYADIEETSYRYLFSEDSKESINGETSPMEDLFSIPRFDCISMLTEMPQVFAGTLVDSSLERPPLI